MKYRKLLIVDDIKINREVLRGLLCNEYEVFEATNGKEAMALLSSKHKSISAVLLDLVMPVMDGYEVLSQIRDNPSLNQIPVLVTTGDTSHETEIKVLGLGANDFITKPYSPEVIKHRLRNTIRLRETASTINALQRDKLTGLFNREAFFERAASLIKEKPSGYYVLSGFDIDNFKIINNRYGAAAGDNILRQIGRDLARDMSEVGGLCGRIAGDNFAVLYPHEHVASGEAFMDKLRNTGFTPGNTRESIMLSVGRFHITDIALPINAIYDRAYIAKQSVKGRYDKHIAYFDDSMLQAILHEQRIVAIMDKALESGQFEIWLQPQFNHATGALIGAEALARWRHPGRGLISPKEFIPIFENNGFIYEMDKYIWEQACILLRRWLDEGLAPLPISVNVSRYDILRDDLTEVITSLVRKYDIPTDLLRLEITESAFANSASRIIAVVKQLINSGFTVEIDDFGSGYSSLNTLKDVPAHVVKLDMRFLESSGNSPRGGNILESVVRMTKWLGMAVIAEGVETVEQANYLQSIGCNYIQGFLYAKPMPAKDYESLGVKVKQKHFAADLVSRQDGVDIWNPESLDSLIFNSYVGSACIFEYKKASIEILRTSARFTDLLANFGLTVTQAQLINWAEHLDENDNLALHDSIECSTETGAEITRAYAFRNLPDGKPDSYLRTSIRVIASMQGRCLVYCLMENISDARRAEQKLVVLREEVLDNLPCCAGIYEMSGDAVRAIYKNKHYMELVGGTPDGTAVSSVCDLIHPDDAEALRGVINAALSSKGREAVHDNIRIKNKNSSYTPVLACSSIIEQSAKGVTAFVTYMPATAEAPLAYGTR